MQRHAALNPGLCFESDHRFDLDPHICSRGLNKSSGALVGEVLVLYVTVLVLAVCVCVALAIESNTG